MFRLVNAKNGESVGCTEKPRFIKKKPSTGCFIQTDEKDAEGVAYLGTAYNLQGKSGIGADDTVILFEFDAGSRTDEMSATIDEHGNVIDEIIVAMLEG